MELFINWEFILYYSQVCIKWFLHCLLFCLFILVFCTFVWKCYFGGLFVCLFFVNWWCFAGPWSYQFFHLYLSLDPSSLIQVIFILICCAYDAFQLSCLGHEPHTCRSITLISHSVLPMDQFFMCSWTIWTIYSFEKM